MSIEVSAPAAPPRANASGESRNAKLAGRAQPGDASPLGFLAALTAADEAVDASAPGEPATAADLVSNDAAAPAGIAQTATDLIANWVQPVTIDPAAVPLGGPDAAPLVQLEGDVVGNGIGIAGRAPGAQMAAADALEARRSALPLTPGAANETPDAQSGSTQNPFEAISAIAMKAAKGQPGAANTSGAPGAIDAMKEHDAKFLAAMDAMKSMISVQQVRDPATPTADMPAALLSTGALPGEKYLRKEGGTELAYAHQTGSAAAATYTMTSLSETPTVAPEARVAEQVAFWISTDVHKAELKLDGIGKDPVEVSIRMSGNEAHVTFRTDELQARGVLEGAADHLKELLQREGLVLAGVSVGSSGAGDAGTNGRKQQQEGRQSGTVAVPVSGLESRRPASSAAGRTLDLFV